MPARDPVKRLSRAHRTCLDLPQIQPMDFYVIVSAMLNAMLAYLISFFIIGIGIGWIVIGWNAATSAIWIGIGLATIAVGAISILKEFQNRMR